MTEPRDPDAKEHPVATLPATKPVVAKKQTLPETTEGMPWPSNHEIKKEGNPFTDRDWRMFLYAWSGLIVRLALIFGAIFSIFQYLEMSEEKRMNRTFELLAEWERPEYQAAQVALRNRLTGQLETNSGLLPSNPSATQRNVYMNRIGLAVMSAEGGTMPLPEFKEHFDRIVSFLNRIATCVQGNQCSRDVTNDYFRDFAVTFWNYFDSYTHKMRESGSTTFSVPLEEFVTGKRPDLSANAPISQP